MAACDAGRGRVGEIDSRGCAAALPLPCVSPDWTLDGPPLGDLDGFAFGDVLYAPPTLLGPCIRVSVAAGGRIVEPPDAGDPLSGDRTGDGIRAGEATTRELRLAGGRAGGFGIAVGPRAYVSA